MAPARRVHVARRFQRAVRIDADLGDLRALEGFVCPRSSAEVLTTMARHVAESGQGAFTWTGPYGSGKSSLVIALGALLHGDKRLRSRAAAIIGKKTADTIEAALPSRTRGWRMLPVVGRRERPAQVIGEAIQVSDFFTGKPPRSWSEQHILKTLEEIAARNPRAGGGLVVFIDEMGKFLESAVHDGADLYLFQQMAELAFRSNRRLIVVGILHQAFEEYAHRLSRETRDEWAKIQGRFVDLAVSTSGDEQIDLLGRAIESPHHPRASSPLAAQVAARMQRQVSPDFARMLEDCWPLHPVTACLLGPLSRRRFGQNQRSIFGFLNSAEPQGFQDFLRHAGRDELYAPDRLWDYLRTNLEPSILASPDGHRWALAAEAVDRYEAGEGKALPLRLLKTVAILDLLKDRSGLTASREMLALALHDSDARAVATALRKLQRRSFLIFRKFADAFAIFEGSDFDLDAAVTQVMGAMDEADLATLNAVAGFQPIVAKRHYHQTGAFRWFDVAVVPLADVEEAVAAYTPRHGAVGAFFLAVPTRDESARTAEDTCIRARRLAKAWDVVIGLSPLSGNIVALAGELSALERVRDETPALQGDRVARIEVRSRVSDVQGRLESALRRAFDTAEWYRKNHRPKPYMHAALNALASDLADARFAEAPRLHNELLGRMKPSSSAVAARNALLRHMVLNTGEARLSIVGYPAEGGLLASLLEATRLYRQTSEGWRFVMPTDDDDPCRLAPVWAAARDFLQSNARRAVPLTEIYDVWRGTPFGIKDGLLPVLAVAFLLSQRTIAFYREGIFQARVSDLDMEYLAQAPEDIWLRWMDLSETSRRLLSDLADVIRDLDETNTLTHLEPIDVGRGLVAIHDRLPPWVGRTQHLSAGAKRLRQLLKQANDPNKLIFDDIPELVGGRAPEVLDGAGLREISKQVREGLRELQRAYPNMLHRLRETLLAELQVHNASPPMLAELRARADNIRRISGDHRLEAFVVRLAQFHGTDEGMESLASMAINKPARDWVDADIDRATIELAAMAQQFIRAEVFAHVKGRRNKRHAMAVVVGMGGRTKPVHDEFDVTDRERGEVDTLIKRLDTVLKDSGEARRNVILAALAELSAEHLKAAATPQRVPASKNKRAASQP